MELKRELQGIDVTDIHELLAWTLLAARLAACGDSSELRKFARRARPIEAAVNADFIGKAAACESPRDLERIARVANVKTFAEKFDAALVARAEAGILTLLTRDTIEDGEDLALEILAAQDFQILRTLRPRLLSIESKTWIARWTEVAERQKLGGRAVEVLKTFTERFPVKKNLLLSIVAVPLTVFEEVIAQVQERAMARAPRAPVKGKKKARARA